METENGLSVYPDLTDAVMALLGVIGGKLGRTIRFETLGDDCGIALFMRDGGTAASEETDITGVRRRVYRQPMDIVYRAAPSGEDGRRYAAETLETIGNWLSGERVTVGGDDGGEELSLDGYPAIKDGRFVRIVRRASYAGTPSKNGVVDRVLPLIAEYERESEY